jgi:precorrin-6B methylase 1
MCENNRKEFVMENLCYKIEYLRQEMHVTALKKGISHPEVLMVSQRLDEVISEFYKFAFMQKAG